MTITCHLVQPTRGSDGPSPDLTAYLALLQLGVTVPRTVTSRAVGSYPTFSPLPAETGGLFSVALSIAFRRPGVTWQSALRSSDFPRPATWRAATITLYQSYVRV